MPKTDRLSHLLAGARNGSLTHYVNQMVNTTSDSRDGALPVETRQAGGVPGPLPRRSPPKTTMKGGHPTPTRHHGRWVKKKRYRFRRSMGDMSRDSQPTEKSLKILQWNAEGIFRKKTQLAQRLKMEDIDIACI